MSKYQFVQLGTILVKEGMINERQLQDALDYIKRNPGKRIGQVLVEQGYLTELNVLSALGMQLGFETVDEESLIRIERDVVRLIPEPFAAENNVIALARDHNMLKVVMEDPDDVILIDNLKKITKCDIVPVMATNKMINLAIDRHYKELKIEGQVNTTLQGVEFVGANEEEGSVDLNTLENLNDEAPIIKFVNMMLREAIKDRATDIHIEGLDNSTLVRYRIDGVLHEIMKPPKKAQNAIVSRIKILADLNIAERRLPQDGRFTMKFGEREVDVRTSILPTVTGEKIVMRLLDKKSFSLSLLNLGFDEDMLAIFRKWISLPYGIIIVSGPTGAGKSTTLYSSLVEVKSTEVNITTVEDPVEYQIEGINQVHCLPKVGLTFASALRSILRQDPDILLIGEIRDLETADIAVKFSLTGHLVFASLHANDAPATITRLIDIGIPEFLVGSSLNMVVAQRLVRKICSNCKEPYIPKQTELEALRLTEAEASKINFMHGKGCIHCRNTGYQGRNALFEILEVNRHVRRMIFARKNQDEIRDEAIRTGMITLRESGLRKMKQGSTTVQEVIKTTYEE
ncbi:Flp pilus assembly complex ATPase component TadA [bacterium]|nr:Flp pilus assembly complex ATPase component TadA [bacterium]